jgi:hypothetical protein
VHDTSRRWGESSPRWIIREFAIAYLDIFRM